MAVSIYIEAFFMDVLPANKSPTIGVYTGAPDFWKPPKLPRRNTRDNNFGSGDHGSGSHLNPYTQKSLS